MLLLSVAACDRSPLPTQSIPRATSEHYQLTVSGSLGDEIVALSLALFPTGLETAAGTRWEKIRDYVAAGDLVSAKARLIELTAWIKQKTPQMDPPPFGETRDAATARLVLYMSLFVYNGPGTPVPSTLGTGADATVAIVTPGAASIVQTPLKHAGARFDIGTVSENTIVVISQNTQYYPAHCGGPFTTKYCQYPLFYHYQAFPAQRFLKSVHLAVCHVATGNNYGPLTGVNHDLFVVAHDKPADPANYTPGGYAVPGENIEILPRNPTYDPTAPLIACSGSVYPFVPPVLPGFGSTRRDALGVMLAAATRGMNRMAQVAEAALTPRSAYAIDLGAETNTLTFSNFAMLDTIGHPDIAVSAGSTPATATSGSPTTVTYTVSNNGTAPSPGVAATFQLTPTAVTIASTPIVLVPTSPPSSASLFPLQSRTETVTLPIPAALASGNYTITVSLASTGGVAELASTLGNNSVALPVAITGNGPGIVSALSATASPTSLSSCTGGVFTFTGIITASAAGTVAYTWDRSDGAMDTYPHSVFFEAPGTQTVTQTWTLGAQPSPFTGWQRLRTLAPNAAVSNQASFTLTCSPIT